jgi:pimeloyl-ACP methyl ester carboxylesterase
LNAKIPLIIQAITMSVPPTIVFVHGAWHGPEWFDATISFLEPLGYKCVTVAMPAVGRKNPVTSLDEDIKAVRTAVMKELDAGQDVIVNAHSWGGLPVNSALDGLSKAERQKDGKKGAVAKLAFVSSFVLPENTSLLDSIGGVAPGHWGAGDVSKIYSHSSCLC